QKIHAGSDFTIKVTTSAAAEEVFLELAGKKQPMEGSGTDWKYITHIASIGTSSYKVTARNKDGKAGSPKEGQVTITEQPPKGINVVSVGVSPKQGNMGQTFTFKATTHAAAKSVTAVIGEKEYKMTGSGTRWTLKRKIGDLGTIDYYVIATDKDDEEGISKGGSFTTKALLANVVEVKTASPGKGYAGEEFTISVNTDNPASAVSLEMDGVTYDMEGSGKNWLFERRFHDVGKKGFTVTAKNVEGAKGRAKSGEILTRLAVPDVTTVSLSPAKVFAGDDFQIKVKTNETAEQVFVEIDGKSHAMTGDGTEWRYIAKIDSVGTSKYKVLAKNREGKGGQSKEGNILASKKPAALINVAKAEVSPEKGYSGGSFIFKATTDRPAQSVFINIGEKDYEMEGSGTDWTLSQKITKTGSVVFSMVAFNEDKVEGVAKTDELKVEALKNRFTKNKDGTITDKITKEVKKRFKDNGDGTVTDLATNLMWLQQPKRVALSYEAAEDFCRKLDVKGQGGWRLPTASEWASFIDKSQKAPALPLGHPFKNIFYNLNRFWSKTQYKSATQRIWVADLERGIILGQSKKSQYIVWPIRAID
ncbi:DUF1566 domain-containing protein, partial [Thermodesulfobacteriota bacterium]